MHLRVPSARFALGVLVAADVLLLLLYGLSKLVLVDAHPTLAHMFDLDGEGNAAAWYASSQLLVVSALSLLYGLQVEDRALRRFYYLLAAVFVFFSADEAAMFHEPLAFFVREHASSLPLPGPEHITWTFPYLVVAVVILAVVRRGLVRFLRCPDGRMAFLAGAGLFVVGGVLVELVGYYVLSRWGIDYYGSGGALQVALEETCEMLGVSLMAYGLLMRLHALEPDQAGVPAG